MRRRMWPMWLAALLLAFSAMTYGQDSPAQLDLLTRPESEAGPTVVWVSMFVIDIGGIDGVAQTFDASVYVRLRWKDPRLAHDDSGRRRLPLAEVWHPKTMFLNQAGILRPSLPMVVRVEQDGTAEYRQRYVGPFSQPLDLEEFPFDEHAFVLHLISPGNGSAEIEFAPDPDVVASGMPGAAGIAARLSLPDWRIMKFFAGERALIGRYAADTAGYAMEFHAQRQVGYYVWKVLLPLVLIVMMAWTAFWIDPTLAGTQIAVATTSMLTLIAYRFLLDSLVPRLPYMTRMDYFILGSTVLVFLTLVEVVVRSSLAKTKRRELARRIDRWSRIAFPLAFVILTLVSFLPSWEAAVG